MSPRKTIVIAVLFSFLLHLLFVGFGLYWDFLGSSKPVTSKDVVEVILVTRKSGYQIADIEPPKKEERPEKAKFKGMYDSKVPEETVAPTRMSASHPPSSPSMPIPRVGTGTRPVLKTPQKEVEDYFNGGVSEDFFPDYKVADHTYLNVLRFPKVGYFVRLKKIYRTTFNPVPVLRAAFSSNQVSKGQVDVVLAVTVDRSGRLADLKVLRSSGIPGYDHEAIRTIHDSAPYAAPPSELLDSESTLRMAWTFTVYL